MAARGGNILILDDNTDICDSLSDVLTTQGYAVRVFHAAPAAIEALEQASRSETPFDLIISDVRLPDMDGLTFVTELRNRSIEQPVILMTAYGSLDVAIKAVRLGAFDFLKKPFDVTEFLVSVERALAHNKLLTENKTLSEEITHRWKLGQIIGKSKAMMEVFDLIKRVARTSANVLIVGESGTGKEVVARSIHENGLQANNPFIAVNCAAIPEELLESELFGHAKGSFTGAHQNRTGLFQEADGGTLFLDEIGDMSVALQAKLLRVLQDKLIKPVGSNTYKQVEVRVIAATHRDLQKAISQGQFREDLFFRLNVITINVPPLRDREDDIILLAKFFLKKFSAIHHVNVKGFSHDGLTFLASRRWPGNVRELENAVERALILAKSNEITQEDLQFDEKSPVTDFEKTENGAYLSLKDLERKYINLILNKTGWKKEKAARILDIDRTTLYRKLNEYNFKDRAPDTDLNLP